MVLCEPGASVYYCQKDGGQWNVPVRVMEAFPLIAPLWQEAVLIRGRDLESHFVDKYGYGYLVVSVNEVYEAMQAESLDPNNGS